MPKRTGALEYAVQSGSDFGWRDSIPHEIDVWVKNRRGWKCPLFPGPVLRQRDRIIHRHEGLDELPACAIRGVNRWRSLAFEPFERGLQFLFCTAISPSCNKCGKQSRRMGRPLGFDFNIAVIETAE